MADTHNVELRSESTGDQSADSAASTDSATSMPRRDALRAMAAAAMVPMIANAGYAQQPPVKQTSAPTRAPLPVLGQKHTKGPRGTPSDPVLIGAKVTWELKLLPSELATLAALCDTIIPADDKSPAASKVGAHHYINEWASRPGGDASLVRVRGGLFWIDRESSARFGKAFHSLTETQRTAICDDICYIPNAKPQFASAALFFKMVRDQTQTAFYTTPEGWKDIGFIGNVAMTKFEGPSIEIQKQIGLV